MRFTDEIIKSRKKLISLWSEQHQGRAKLGAMIGMGIKYYEQFTLTGKVTTLVKGAIKAIINKHVEEAYNGEQRYAKRQLKDIFNR